MEQVDVQTSGMPIADRGNKREGGGELHFAAAPACSRKNISGQTGHYCEMLQVTIPRAVWVAALAGAAQNLPDLTASEESQTKLENIVV